MRFAKSVAIRLVLAVLCLGFFAPYAAFAFDPVPFQDRLYNKAVWVEIGGPSGKTSAYQGAGYTEITVRVKRAYNYEPDPESLKGFAHVSQIYVPDIYLDFVGAYGEALVFCIGIILKTARPYIF